jgi:hypothetical protein
VVRAGWGGGGVDRGQDRAGRRSLQGDKPGPEELVSQKLMLRNPHIHLLRQHMPVTFCSCCSVIQSAARRITWEEGRQFAKEQGCLFVETSAKENVAVSVAFSELILRILDTESLLEAQSDEEEALTVQVQPQEEQRKPHRGISLSCSC